MTQILTQSVCFRRIKECQSKSGQCFVFNQPVKQVDKAIPNGLNLAVDVVLPIVKKS